MLEKKKCLIIYSIVSFDFIYNKRLIIVVKIKKISAFICLSLLSIQGSPCSATSLNITRGTAVATALYTGVRFLLKNDLAPCCSCLRNCLGNRRGILCCGLQNVLDSGFVTLAGLLADAVAFILDVKLSNSKTGAYVAYGLGIATHGAQMLFDLYKMFRKICSCCCCASSNRYETTRI